MVIVGQFLKEGKYCVALVESLGVFTHGRNRNDLYAMVIDGVIGRVSDDRLRTVPRGFTVDVTDDGKSVFITSSDDRVLTAAVLRYQRQRHQLSLTEVAVRLGVKNRNAYALYERGKTMPTLGKLDQLLAVVAPELMCAIGPRGAPAQEQPRKRGRPGPRNRRAA